jgi:SAM-dependent methyltransferase
MVEKSEHIKEHVRKRYSEVARRSQEGAGCCSDASCCGALSMESYAASIGYTAEELGDLPEHTLSASAGCGNPTALAALKEGEVVLDLGSGGGIDVFLASKKVGPSGRAIGVDMTQEMIDLARKSAAKMGVENVEFRLGEIEDLPVDNESVDVIISNCVINLSPDKDRVFREAYRVLNPGGRITVSDIVTDGPLPEEIRENPDQWASCIAGALDQRDYIDKISKAGFQNVKVLSRKGFDIAYSVEIEAHKPA